jgi:hypothetical protein
MPLVSTPYTLIISKNHLKINYLLRSSVLMINCVFDVSKLCSLNVKQMELQLAWHRLSDKAVPKCKELPRRAEKLVALTEAVERYNLREALLDGAAEYSEPGASIQCGIDRDDVNLADDDWDMETE